MRVKHLNLENYRGFEKLEMEFPEEGGAVFIGVNGAGKSSLLSAIGKILGKIVLEKSEEYYRLLDTDIHYGNERCKIKMDFEYGGRPESITIWRSITNGVQRVAGLVDILNLTLRNNEKNIEEIEVCFPTLIYYRPNRAMVDLAHEISQEIEIFRLPQMRAYKGAFEPRIDFTNFTKWFVEEENKENREKIKLKDFSYVNPNLNPVRSALTCFFEKLEAHQFSGLKVEDRELNKYSLSPNSLAIRKNDKDLNLAQLSDGEKLIIAMVADIAHRLTLANPGIEDKLTGAGIVLIDELELHLHPGWQRFIIPALEATFPNIQFIATTHSPQVLSSLKRENVFILEDFKLVEKTPHTFGRDSNSILQDLFNVAERPEDAKEEFRRLYRLMDDPEKAGEANDMLREMESKYGSDDPEIIRARMHQEFMNEE